MFCALKLQCYWRIKNMSQLSTAVISVNWHQAMQNCVPSSGIQNIHCVLFFVCCLFYCSVTHALRDVSLKVLLNISEKKHGPAFKFRAPRSSVPQQ